MTPAVQFAEYYRLARKAGIFAVSPHTWKGSLASRVVPALEHRTVLKALKPKVLIDVGANRGQFYMMARAYEPTLRASLIEPMPSAAEALRQHTQQYPNVKVYECAIGAGSGTASLHLTEASDQSSILTTTDRAHHEYRGSRSTGELQVRVETLDALLSPEMSGGGLLKIDVQGYELEVLKGASDHLRHLSYVYVEVSFEQYYRDQPLAGEVISAMAERDYEFAGVGFIDWSRSTGVARQADLLFRNSLTLNSTGME